MGGAAAVKRWSTNRGGWSRVPKQRLEVRQVGNTTLVYLKALSVREPLTVPCCGQPVKIMDVGYQWLTICEVGARHIVTAHCNAEGEPVHLYIDVIASWHVGEDGFPCFDDLYLDVITLPDGRFEVIDGDELEAALKARVISRAQYEGAWREAERVAATLEDVSFAPMEDVQRYLSLFGS